MRKGRAAGEFAGQRLRLFQQFGRLVQGIEKAPGQALRGGHGAPGEQQLRSAALANQPGQQGTGAHIGTSQPDPGEQKRGFGAGRAQPHVAGQRHHGAGTGANSVNGANDRLRTIAHGLDQVASHTGKGQQLGHAHAGEWADDLVHIAARAKICAGTGHYHRLDIGAAAQAVEQAA